jgi:hypothetical protein
MPQRQPTFASTFMRGLAEVNADQAKQTSPEHHHYCQNRPQLDHHLECFCGITLKTQQVANNNHMAGTGNG